MEPQAPLVEVMTPTGWVADPEAAVDGFPEVSFVQVLVSRTALAAAGSATEALQLRVGGHRPTSTLRVGRALYQDGESYPLTFCRPCIRAAVARGRTLAKAV